MEKKKRGLLHVAICVGLVCLIWGGYFFANKKVTIITREKHYSRISETAVTEDHDIYVSIEDVNKKEDEICLTGWALHIEGKNKDVIFEFKPEDGSASVFANAERVVRKDVDEYFSTLERGEGTGFEVSIPLGELKKDVCYEILVNMEYEKSYVSGASVFWNPEEKKVSSNVFYYNQDIYRYNPLEFVKPEISDGRLSDVLEQGTALAYDMEQQLYVYYYANRIYIIIRKENALFSGNCYVPFHMYTFEYEKLAEDSRKDKYENRDFYFESNEIFIDDEEYRITVKDLSDVFKTTYLVTGLYNIEQREWLWKNDVFVGDILFSEYYME